MSDKTNVIPHLRLNYTEWTRFVQENEATLSSEDKEWLRIWGGWDLACSPMDDEHRRLIRFGHYLGFTRRTLKETPQ